MLPKETDKTYRLCSFERLENGFSATLRLSLRTEEAAREWLFEFNKKSKETFRIESKHSTSESFKTRVLLKVCTVCLSTFDIERNVGTVLLTSQVRK